MGFEFADAITTYRTIDNYILKTHMYFEHDDYLRHTKNIDYVNALMLNYGYSDSLKKVVNFVYGNKILINYLHEDKMRHITKTSIDKMIGLNTTRDDVIKNAPSDIIFKEIGVNYNHLDNRGKVNTYSKSNIVNVDYTKTDSIYDAPSDTIQKSIKANYNYSDLFGLLVDAGIAKYINDVNFNHDDNRGLNRAYSLYENVINTDYIKTDAFEEPTVGWVEGGTEQEDDDSPDECINRSDIYNVKSDYESRPVECYWDDTGTYLSSKNLDEQKPACETGAEYTSCVEIEDLATGEIYYNCTDYYAVTSELVKVYYTCEVIEQ